MVYYKYQPIKDEIFSSNDEGVFFEKGGVEEANNNISTKLESAIVDIKNVAAAPRSTKLVKRRRLWFVQKPGKSCVICGKVFDLLRPNGKRKTLSAIKVAMQQHYTHHFRLHLVKKYPTSFSGKPPFSCAKCGFTSSCRSTLVAIHKMVILTHVASCQGELDALILGSIVLAEGTGSALGKTMEQDSAMLADLEWMWSGIVRMEAKILHPDDDSVPVDAVALSDVKSSVVDVKLCQVAMEEDGVKSRTKASESRHIVAGIMEQLIKDFMRSHEVKLKRLEYVEVPGILAKQEDSNEAETNLRKPKAKIDLLEMAVEQHILSNQELAVDCQLCDKTFASTDLRAHVLVEHCKNKLSKCSLCDREFITKIALKKHILQVHMRETVSCHFCHKEVRDLHHHIKYFHGNKRKYLCSYCEKNFQTNTLLQAHISSVHMGKRINCPDCKKDISVDNFYRHRKEKHDQIKKACPHCKKEFGPSNLNRHIRQVHNDERSTCPECGKVLTRANLNKHIKAVHKKLKKICDICNEELPYASISVHKRKFHNIGKPINEVTPRGPNPKLKKDYRIKQNQEIKEGEKGLNEEVKDSDDGAELEDVNMKNEEEAKFKTIIVGNQSFTFSFY